MAWQLIYTSAPRTLTAGQTGYGTVARSGDLRDALIQRLEQLSYFQHGDNRATTPPVIHAYRILDLRGAKYHVLTRLVDAGLDFTNRTNHLAHHLVFTPEELAAKPSPALIFLHWTGWRDAWKEEPRFLDAGDWLGFDDLPRAAMLPAESWSRLTGDAGRAAALLTRPAANGCQLACEPGQESEWLALFAESLQLLDPEKKSPAQRWTFPFTTHLQEQDQPNDFRWRGGASSSPGALRATDLPVPSGELAELARRGPKKPFIPPAAPRVGAAPVVTAKPALAKPDNSTARPLRLQGKTTVATARKDEESADEPRHSSGARRAIPVVVAMLAVCLGLGFWIKRGGESKISSSTKAPVDSREQLALDSQTGGGNTTTISIASANGPSETNAQVVATPKSEPTDADKLELNQRLGSLPTYLHIHDFSKPLGLPAHSKLLSFFRSIMANEGADIYCRAVANALGLDVLEKAAEKKVRLNRTEKFLRVPESNTAQEDFKIVFKDWFFNQTNAQKNSTDIQFTAPPSASLAILFQPKAGTDFEPFRILIVNDGEKVPVQLSMNFLSANRTNFNNTVDELVREKLKAIERPAGFRWQLRPFINNPPADLHDQLFAHLPLPREGLDFATLTNRLQAMLDDSQMRSRNLGKEISALREAIHQALTNKLSDDEAKKSNQQKSATEISKLKQQLRDAGFQGLKENHLIAHWESLNSDAKSFSKKLGERQAANNKADELAAALKKIPPDLASTAYVGLFLVDEKNDRRRLEIIRFTDASEPKTK